jgi:hypothetical protein
MPCVLAAPLAEFLELKPTRSGLLVLGGRIIPLFAIAALQRNYFSHKNQPLALSHWLLARFLQSE